MNRPAAWRQHPLESAWVAVRDSRVLPVVLVVLVAMAAGYLGASNRPLVVIGLTGISFALAMVAGLGRHLTGLFLRGVVVILIGYAFFGRGFAHVGLPPLYISEMLFGLGLLAALVTPLRLRFGLTEWLIIAFIGWGVVNTIPYVSTYAVDAVRDAAFWGYSLFALAISLFVVRRSQIERVVRIYAATVPIFLLFVPVYRVALAIGFPFPRLPIADIPFFTFKPGDMGVHLAGIAGFLLLGLYWREKRSGIATESWLWVLWLLTFVIVAAANRGGMLAAGMGLGLAIALRPTWRVAPALGVGVFLFSLALLVNPTVSLGGTRDISVEQLVTNAASIFVDTDQQRVEGTKEWRLEWWGEIMDYTFFGPYFMTGKGFGVNLAEDDGFLVVDELRSPHNGHMTALARMGVPGLAIWIALHLSFAIAMLRGFLRASRRGQDLWAGVFGWVLVFWTAAMVNGAFDVYLEGPQGAIWTWVMMGLGLAALRLSAEEPVQGTPPRARRPSAGRDA